MSLVPRNSPCPCGSGRKYKRCCIDRERELVRQREALAEAALMPTFFPRLRPRDAEFEAWAAGPAPRESLDAAAQRIGRDERERILRVLASDHAEAWTSLVAEAGDEAAAEEMLLVGAAGAALQERRELDPHLIEEYEELRDDPAEALAAVIEGCDLWSVVEALVADEEGDPGAVAARFWSGDHEERLAVLVERVRAQLPAGECPRASAALDAACAAFGRDAALRRRLGALLLEDAVAAARLLHVCAALAA